MWKREDITKQRNPFRLTDAITRFRPMLSLVPRENDRQRVDLGFYRMIMRASEND